jgi:hypothetical protein
LKGYLIKPEDSPFIDDIKSINSDITNQQKPSTNQQKVVDKNIIGKTYTDKKGNKAKYLGNNKWEEVK